MVQQRVRREALYASYRQEEAAARVVGLNYFHVPFAGKPDPSAAEASLKAITSPGAEPYAQAHRR